MQLKNILIMSCLAVLSAQTAYAIERDSATHKFVWGDDLSSTSDTIGGTNQTAYPATIKASHLSDIKQAIDILSSATCGTAVNSWANADTRVVSQIGYPGTALPSTHINVLRRAIEALYQARYPGGVPSASTYFSGSVNPGDRISKTHIQQMRLALDDLAVTCVGGPAQVVACYSQSIGFGPIGGCDNQQQYVSACEPKGTGCSALNGPCAPIYVGDPEAVNCPSAPSCIPDGDAIVPIGACNSFYGRQEPWIACCSGTAFVRCMIGEYPEGTCGTLGPISVCGNGAVEGTEECDDGNTVGGDGCSGTCTIEALMCPAGSTLKDPPPLYQDEQSCLVSGNADCGAIGLAFAGTCGGSFQPCCVNAPCDADGTTFTRGTFPITNDQRILTDRCCSGGAICYAGTTTCECGGGSTRLLLCGNGRCGPGEDCTNCPSDCGACSSQVCGNAVREGTEACDLGIVGNGVCPKTCSTLCQINTCAPTATCSDGIQNQGETGVDCGGPCAACGGGTVGPCGAATCYKCNLAGNCVQNNTTGTYSDATCNFECGGGGGGGIIP